MLEKDVKIRFDIEIDLEFTVENTFLSQFSNANQISSSIYIKQWKIGFGELR